MNTTLRQRFGFLVWWVCLYFILTNLPYDWAFAPFDALLCVGCVAISEYLWPTPDDAVDSERVD